MKPLVIVGIDPGTTIGLTVLDLHGQPLLIRSGKNYTLADIIDIIIPLGKVVALGCDKKQAPHFASRLATKFGARLITPKEDMSVKEKRFLTRGFAFSHDHERDALASALLAYGEIVPVMNRLHKAWQKNDHSVSLHTVLEIGLRTEGLSSARILEMANPIVEQIRKKIPDVTTKNPTEEKLTRLRSAYRKLETAFETYKQKVETQVKSHQAMSKKQHKRDVDKLTLMQKHVHREKKLRKQSDRERDSLEKKLLLRQEKAWLYSKDMTQHSCYRAKKMCQKQVNAVVIDDPARWDEKGVVVLEGITDTLIVTHVEKVPRVVSKRFRLLPAHSIEKISAHLCRATLADPRRSAKMVEKMVKEYRASRTKK